MVGFKHFISKSLRRRDAMPRSGEKTCLECRGRARGRRLRPLSDYGDVHLEEAENSSDGLTELLTGPGLMKACFLGGSYWIMEAAFGCVEGVMSTAVGHCTVPENAYSTEPDMGRTFAVLVTYDPQEVTYQTLLQTFWQVHDATERSCQPGGRDSCIFYYTGTQRRTAHQSRVKHQISVKKRIVTRLMPAVKFVYADAYYQKRVLQSRHHQLFKSLEIPSFRKLIESSVACRLNGYLAGIAGWRGGQELQFQFSLSEETREQLRLLDIYRSQTPSQPGGPEPGISVYK